jgi:phospholipase/carboxylesterase
LHVALRAARPLAGVLALSTYLPLAGSVAAERSAASLGVPIWMAHGSADPVIPLAGALASRDHLERLGYGVTWHTYAMGHSVCAEQVRDMSAWLTLRLQ